MTEEQWGKGRDRDKARRGRKRKREREKKKQVQHSREGKRRTGTLSAVQPEFRWEEGVRSPASPECGPQRSPGETEPQNSQGSRLGPKWESRGSFRDPRTQR